MPVDGPLSDDCVEPLTGRTLHTKHEACHCFPIAFTSSSIIGRLHAQHFGLCSLM